LPVCSGPVALVVVSPEHKNHKRNSSLCSRHKRTKAADKGCCDFLLADEDAAYFLINVEP
jgi:hypothetical protein